MARGLRIPGTLCLMFFLVASTVLPSVMVAQETSTLVATEPSTTLDTNMSTDDGGSTDEVPAEDRPTPAELQAPEADDHEAQTDETAEPTNEPGEESTVAPGSEINPDDANLPGEQSEAGDMVSPMSESTITVVAGGEVKGSHQGQTVNLFPNGADGMYTGQFDEQGIAVISNVPLGSYSIMVVEHGYYAFFNGSVNLNQPNHQITLQFQLAPTDDVVILGGSHGSEHAGATVRLDTVGPTVNLQGELDANGTFTFADVPYGAYHLTISAHNGYAEYSETISVWEQTQAVNPDYQLVPEVGEIEVLPVTLPAGLDPGTLTISSVDTVWSEQFDVEHDRGFIIEIPAGNYVWSLDFGRDFNPQSGEVEVLAGDSTILDIRSPISVPTVADPGGAYAAGEPGPTITGSGFLPNEELEFRFLNYLGPVIGAVTTDPGGDFSYDLMIPSWAHRGVHTIAVMGTGGLRVTFQIEVNQVIQPILILDQDQAIEGETVEFTATGFSPFEDVQMYINVAGRTRLGGFQADEHGSYSGSFVVPRRVVLNVNYTVTADGGFGRIAADQVRVVGLIPIVIQANPDAALAGSQINVTGSGFYPDHTVTVRIGGSGGQSLGTVRPNQAGEFSRNVTIPTTTQPGSIVLYASNDENQSAQTTFTVVPTPTLAINISPTSADGGDLVHVTGTGFGLEETVDLYWNVAEGVPAGTFSADSFGSFAGDIRVPWATEPVEITLFAVGRDSEKSTNTQIQVTVPAVVVTLGQLEANPSDVISVDATGFQPGETVEMFFGAPDGVIVRRVTASVTGEVTSRVTIPAWIIDGTHQIEVIGVQSGQRGIAEIEVVLPESVVTLSPAQAEAGWLVLVDASGFRPGETVEMFFGSPDGLIVRRVIAASDGSVSTHVRVPINARLGSSAIEIRGLESGQVVVEPFTVTTPVDAELMLNTSSGDAGQQVLVTGTGFLPYEQVEVFFGSQLVHRLDSNIQGTIVVNITIPLDAISGPVEIVAKSASGKMAAAQFTVIGIDVILSTTEGDAGSRVTVSADGFAPGEQVEMFFGLENPVIVRRVNASSNGSVATSVTIPVRADAGLSAILVRGAHGKAAQVPFTVTGAEVTLSVNAGDAGTLVTVTATGFEPGEQVEMFFGSPNGVIIRRVNTNMSGTVITTVRIPVWAASGASVIEVKGTSGKSATAPFTVSGVGATVSPNSAAAGTLVTVTATGFGPGEQVEMFFGSPNGVIVRRANTNMSGTVITTVRIPVWAAPGASVIEVKGTSGKSATVPFSVTTQSP